MEEERKESKKKEAVTQYLQPSMSNELLCKFPDNSAFDFDYSQSSIWSPLVPRFHSLTCLNPNSPVLNRKLSFDNPSFSNKLNNQICTFGFNFDVRFQKKKNKIHKKMLKFNDETSQFQSPPSTKGWKKVLKMTSKQFKKKRVSHHHHRHPISRVTLADYLQSKDF